MTKAEAIRELYRISSGTLAGLLGTPVYTEIDTKVEHLVEVIQEELVDVSICRTWQDVWKMLEDAGEV